MNVYLIAGLLLVLVGCGLSMDATQGESRFILEEPIKDSSFEKSRPILSDLFVHASEDAKLDKRSIHKDTFNHSQCANLKAHGFCKYSIIKDTYCHTTCRCNDILSKDSCKKIKERNECDRFREHCKLTCLKCGQCDKHALGMESRAIPNVSITASSTLSGFSPSNARLNNRGPGSGCWAAKHKRAGEWIQVDLGKVTMVTGCATQGRYDSAQWVRSYILQYSLDGTTFKAYEGGKVFSANKDRNTVVKHELKPAIIARYIRLVAKTFQYHISMRMELYGCKQ